MTLVLKTKLNGKNKINTVNTWAVSVLRNTAGIVRWTKEELKTLNRMIRRVMLIGCMCQGWMEARDWWGMCENSVEVLLQEVRATSVIRIEETVSKDEFKTSWNNEKLNSWKGKRLHGQFLREIPETMHVEESWSWLRRADLKIQTEALNLCRPRTSP